MNRTPVARRRQVTLAIDMTSQAPEEQGLLSYPRSHHNGDMGFEIVSLGQVAITVASVARAKDFYTDVIGLEHLFDAGPNLVFLSAKNVRIMLTAPENEFNPGNNSVLYFKVDNVDSAHQSATAKGAQDAGAPHMIAEMSDHELWMGFVKDPDGNLVGFMEERPLS